MGKTEKIVVLSVLFVVVMLFTWSLQSDGSTAQTKDGSAATAEIEASPGDDAGKASDGKARTLKRDGGGTEGLELSPRNDGDASLAGTDEGERISLVESGGLLVAEVEPKPIRMQPGWDLVTTAGLTPTIDPGTMVTTPREGATWESLARDLYGDESKASLLRHSNEGMAAPVGQVLVPVKDEIGTAVDERVVEVLEGESLWGVAARTLGNGARWREIFEANTDVLTDPDFVAPGTRLKIPAQR